MLKKVAVGISICLTLVSFFFFFLNFIRYCFIISSLPPFSLRNSLFDIERYNCFVFVINFFVGALCKTKVTLGSVAHSELYMTEEEKWARYLSDFSIWHASTNICLDS